VGFPCINLMYFSSIGLLIISFNNNHGIFYWWTTLNPLFILFYAREKKCGTSFVKWYAIDALTSYEEVVRTFETYEDFNACCFKRIIDHHPYHLVSPWGTLILTLGSMHGWVDQFGCHASQLCLVVVIAMPMSPYKFKK
jgi:hypothetical protein